MKRLNVQLALGALSLCLIVVYSTPQITNGQAGTATTTLSLSICGNALVDVGEECDVPGETGTYSTTIAGRQCTPTCDFGPYCGDGILQTLYTEECDDGNNDDDDFCSATCKIEPAGSGGGGTSGGGSGGGGGSSVDLGDTVISVVGYAYPSRTVNILLDTDPVGSVRANTSGRFEFSTAASPGTATMGFWALDDAGTRSLTFNTTFDVTQGAITNVNGVVLPPTIRLSAQTINPGDVLSVSGQSIPNARIEVHLSNQLLATTTASASGIWSVTPATSRIPVATHTIKARSLSTGALAPSAFSTALQLFVGVNGRVTSPSDLNRDTRINLVDFSILIFWWGSAGGNSNPPADINGNGRVGIEDFSILLFNWTG